MRLANTSLTRTYTFSIFRFFMDGLGVGQPTPIYDMLPMAYMPKQGELINPELDIPRFVDVSNLAKHTTMKAAIDFWQKSWRTQGYLRTLKR